jgi:hypothetical protein
MRRLALFGGVEVLLVMIDWHCYVLVFFDTPLLLMNVHIIFTLVVPDNPGVSTSFDKYILSCLLRNCLLCHPAHKCHITMGLGTSSAGLSLGNILLVEGCKYNESVFFFFLSSERAVGVVLAAGNREEMTTGKYLTTKTFLETLLCLILETAYRFILNWPDEGTGMQRSGYAVGVENE